MHTRRNFLGAMAGAAMASGRASRPNLVFILTDDQRWDAMSCAGHPFLKTPNLDRIASEGVRFRNAFVTTPLCSPSRASFLTGRYVHSHGVIDNTNHDALSHELITWPRLLRDAGYETAYVGKWHMGTDSTPRPGFDRWVSFKGQGAYNDPALNIDGSETHAEGYMTDILTGHATEFLRMRREKPFVLYLAHKAVHGPFTPAERHKDLFANESIRRAPNAQDTLEGKPVLRRPIQEMPTANKKGGKQASGGQGRGPGDEVVRNQLRALMAVEESTGEVFKALEETRQLDNTVLVFTSDNGYFWGEHGLGDKRAAYEESIRIPLVMRFPRLIKPGTTLDEAALNIDIAPTMLDLAGARVPNQVEGRSLAPLFKGRARWRTSFLAEYFAERQYPRIPTWRAVRTDRWKYIRYEGLENMDELYDLRADPYEMNNLIQSAEAQSTVRELKAELDRLAGRK